MIVLGIPVVNQKQLTKDCLHALSNSTTKFPNEVNVVVIDNGSRTQKYSPFDFPHKNYPFNIKLKQNKQNLGYYLPLRQLYEEYPDAEFIGLMHNDVFIYEPGWEERIVNEFRKDQHLGLIGLVGSNEVDSNGGRGGGTMCNFNGTRGQSQSAGLKITELHPAMILDSLFMMFRREVIPQLLIDEKIAPCHFYDKIWSMRTIENNWRVGCLGLEIDHMGGMTAIGDTQYWDDAVSWCKANNIPLVKNDIGDEDGGLTVYIEAERRFLSEYRDQKKRIPSRINDQWIVRYN